jgi:hypothetical protein
MVNVISFCLYGNKATYILGMIENIKIAKNIYKNWDIYIYFNETVPENFIKKYLELGAKCIKCENIGNNKKNWEGMFWRFIPFDDIDVDFWISRDADSRLSQREFNLVEEWMKSNKTLHVIRDHRCHFNYIMGGMFGINNKLYRERYSGKIKTIRDTIKDLYQYYKERPYNVDQIWLNDKFWNVLKNDHIAHISKEARRVYETDILIKSDTHFIGKQYKLPDFKNNIYNKKLLLSATYGTKDKNIDVKNIIIKNIKHNILSLSGKYNKIFMKDPIYGKKKQLIITYFLEKSKKIELKFNENEKVELENIYHQDKGIYWKITSTPHIYYSNSSFMVKRDIKFNNPNEYYNHRTKNGHPRNWSNIHNFDESDIISDDLKKNIKDETVENMSNVILKNRDTQCKKISIAISTYEVHGEGYKLLTKNLDQILTQSYSNIEVVISDHSKDDKIKNVCNKYQQLFNTKNYTLKYIQNTKYYGNSSQNINNAINNCTGEFIKILFMDDYLLNKDAIKLLVKEFEKESNKNKKWLVHSYQHTKDYKELYKYHHPSFNNNIALKNTIGCPSCLIIHSSIKERFDENLKWYMDCEYYSRLNKNYGGPIIKHTPNDEAYVVQLIHDKQVTNKDINDKLIKNEEKYINFFNKNNEFLMTRYTSNTVLNKCDVIIEKGKIIKDENSNNQSNNYKTIGIKSDHDTLFQSLNFFINNYLDKINNKFILYTNSGDWTLPNQLDKRWPERKKEAKLIYNKIINNKYLEHWFIENCDQEHNKITFLPIGINPREFHNNIKIINNLTNHCKRLNIENKNSKIFYCSRIHSKNDKQFELRREYYEILKQDKFKRLVDTFDRLKQELFRNKLKEYSFCICIHGGGIDLCPKLFECLIYGCIPIINSSSYDNIYNKLPVVICKSIKDELNETNLKQWKEKFEPYFTNLELKNKWLPMLYQDYWLNYNNFN